jgi:UPF0755 protein
MSGDQIATQLEREGLIKSARYFGLLARLRRYDRSIRAGTHWVDGNQRTSDILTQLLSGGLRITRVTVPEGKSILQIASILAAELPFDSAAFVMATRDSITVAQWVSDTARTLEGYLYPDTYFLDVNTNEREAITILAERFREVFTTEMRERADSIGMTTHELITLASIIEKEAQVASERGIISQVFHTRLKIGYKLGSDPTVKYAMGTANRRLSFRDVEIDSPYNTYRYYGLPPGPICSPGRGAILAALHPDDTDFLYFVANWDGTHTFTRSLRQHVAAKRISNERYQEWRREQRRREAAAGG